MKTLKEAPMKIKIEVTQADITKGVRGDPNTCAIARAVKRVMGDNPNVNGPDFSVTIGNKEYYYDMPAKAETFIGKFDDDKKSVKPFSFVAKRT